ncbi:MAG TPA: galactose-1-phosphate uridylyltransferase [Gaiellaceae bacterium]|jgi:UDPglucose--hexose-1-phosphate uridylyltransferase|nr:galactose-1-phosphate uridylyltransferase [Gaiellaceae bacterium]
MRERRRDPVTGAWTTFANVPPDRRADELGPCPLCRLTDEPFDVLVVEDPLPPLEPSPPPAMTAAADPYAVAAAVGASELVVHGPDHDATLASLGAAPLEHAVHVWADRYAELGGRPEVGYALVHAAVGDDAGATLLHPHSRIEAYPEIPPVPLQELQTARDHLSATGRCVLCDVLTAERHDPARVVAANESFLALVPFAARFPYEVHVLAQRHAPSLLDLTDVERAALADLLHRVLAGYDRLFGFPVSYALAIHQAPTDDGQWQSVSHFHVELVPPHRAAEELRRPYPPELAAGAYVNAAVPERAAAELRAALAA